VEDADFFIQTRAELEMISTNRCHPDEYTSLHTMRETIALYESVTGISQLHAGNVTSQ
jgi:hypothetical protein